MAFANLVRVSDHDVMSELFRRIIQILISILFFAVPFGIMISIVCVPEFCDFLFEIINEAIQQTHKVVQSFFCISSSVTRFIL